MKYILALFFLCTGCIRNFSEPLCNFISNGNNRVEWHKDIPVSIAIDGSVPSSFNQAIYNAMTIWNNQKQFFIINPGSNNKIYYVNSNWSRDLNEEASTSDYWSGNQIYHSDIYINGQYFAFDTTNSGSPMYVNLESLMIHELGHVLGLAHINNTTSVMYPALQPGQLRLTLGTIDINDIQCGYN